MSSSGRHRAFGNFMRYLTQGDFGNAFAVPPLNSTLGGRVQLDLVERLAPPPIEADNRQEGTLGSHPTHPVG